MTSAITFTMIDNSAETSSMTIYVPQITAANHDTIVGLGPGENAGELKSLVSAVSLLNHVRANILHSFIPDLGSLPASPNAQREQGLLVNYVDNVTTKKYRMTFPGVDRTLFAVTGTDDVDLTSGNGLAVKTDLETYAVSLDGNPITVQTAKLIGRNT